jgi:hypothetical protein
VLELVGLRAVAGKRAGGRAVPATSGNGSANTTPVPAGSQAKVLTVTAIPAARIGELAASSAIVLHELTPELASLEEAFLELNAGSLESGHLDAKPAAGAISWSWCCRS